MDAVPRVPNGGGHHHRAAGLAGRVDHAAQVPEAHRDQREDRIDRRPDGVGARVGHAVDEDVARLRRCRAPRRKALRLHGQRSPARLVDAARQDLRRLARAGQQRVDLEDAPPQPRLEVVAHLVEDGVHAVAVE